MENEREMRTDRSSLNLPHATQHLVMTEASSQLPAQDKHSPMWQKDGTTSSFSRPTLTSAISLASIGLACSVQSFHLKLASGFRRPDMPLHSLWIQLEQPPHKMVFVPTRLRHTLQGSLPDFWSTSSPGPNIRTLVLPVLTRNSFPSISVFQGISFSNPSGVSVIMIRSSAYRFSQGHPVRNAWEMASRTMMNSKGRNQHERCFWRFHKYYVWAAPATHQLRACEEPTRSNAFFRSTKAIHGVFVA